MYGIAADGSGQYAITDEVIQIFVDDLERAIRSRLTKDKSEEIGETEEDDDDDHFVYRVESFSSRFVCCHGVIWTTFKNICFVDLFTATIQMKTFFIVFPSTQLGHWTYQKYVYNVVRLTDTQL